MKQGCRPVVLGGVQLVPEHPTYWLVPASDAAAVEQLVEDGRVEYESEFARGAAGKFAVPGLEVVQRPPNAGKFSRKK
jgi:hypothetical protein